MNLSISDLVPIVKEQILKGDCVINVYGISMMPFLKNKDRVSLTKPDNLKKNDIVLYQREEKVYVLHRIIRVNQKEEYTICGDNQTTLEFPIHKEQIIAKVNRYYSYKKPNKARYLKGFRYKLYLLIWNRLFLRKCILKVLHLCHYGVK